MLFLIIALVIGDTIPSSVHVFCIDPADLDKGTVSVWHYSNIRKFRYEDCSLYISGMATQAGYIRAGEWVYLKKDALLPFEREMVYTKDILKTVEIFRNSQKKSPTKRNKKTAKAYRQTTVKSQNACRRRNTSTSAV